MGKTGFLRWKRVRHYNGAAPRPRFFLRGKAPGAKNMALDPYLLVEVYGRKIKAMATKIESTVEDAAKALDNGEFRY